MAKENTIQFSCPWCGAPAWVKQKIYKAHTRRAVDYSCECRNAAIKAVEHQGRWSSNPWYSRTASQ